MSENAATDGPVFQVEQKGGFASRMIQYMVALKFQSLVPGCRISNVTLPDWGIEHPPVGSRVSKGPAVISDQYHSIDWESLTRRARDGEARHIVYSGLGQRLENFLDVEIYRDVVRSPAVASPAFDARYLVCPLVAEDAPDDRGPVPSADSRSSSMPRSLRRRAWTPQCSWGRGHPRCTPIACARRVSLGAVRYGRQRAGRFRGDPPGDRTSSSTSAPFPGWRRGCHAAERIFMPVNGAVQPAAVPSCRFAATRRFPLSLHAVSDQL